ncbi:adenosylcobalamin-dependent ribonucleoside-diphosphate reductase [Candidatus Woesearchaeota archaeon]|nr:adenosylcobalamin-dependent ribonucleoside-diphosphate reductase [Candidatus Woesearchaeota archaeon]
MLEKGSSQLSGVKKIEKIVKRDGRLADFDQNKITNAIFKAASSVGGKDLDEARRLSDLVVEEIISTGKRFPTVEEMQDLVEKVLIKEGHAKTAKAYILYRAKRAELRQAALESDRGTDKEKSDLLHMFAHKSKIASLIGYDRLESYKELLFYLRGQQKQGKIPVHKNYLDENEMAITIYQRKYFLKNLQNELIEKRPEDTFARMAAFMSAVEPAEKQKEWAENFYHLLYKGQFLPGGRVIAGAGDLYRLKTLANCFVTVIEDDNLEAMYKAAYECARTYSFGGGIGIDISVLRPRDAIVHNAADHSTGSVSFMELYSLTTGLIGQSGRRGALMLTIDVKHPDSPAFINVKKIPNWVTNQIVEQCKVSNNFTDSQLREIQRRVRENTQVRFANISLKVSDEFLQAVEEQNQHGDKIIVYEKDKSLSTHGVMQGGSINFSYGIPSKPIDRYKMLGAFSTISQLNAFLAEQGARTVSEAELDDNSKRDMFADLIISTLEKDFAIKRSGDFVLYFNSPQTGEIKKLIKARDLWNKFVAGNYKTAEPGLVFWTTMSNYSPSNYVGRPIASTNPCGEVPLEDGGACNLGSLNLSRFVINGYTENAEIDWGTLEKAVSCAIRFLDNVVTWNETLNALEKQRTAASLTRRLGLGIMGIADMLNQLGLGYDSEEGVKIMEKVMSLIANNAYKASAILAEEKGSSPVFDYSSYSKGKFFNESLDEETRELIRQKGLRNIALLSIAPTGTISNIALSYQLGDRNFIGVSGGIEPIFALYYTRRSESFEGKRFKVFHSTVDAYIKQHGLEEEAQKSRDSGELKEVLPTHFFRTSHFIDPEKRVIIQGICQRYIDHSISSTVNLPEDIDPELISNVYIKAWKNKLKGITIYRDGSRYPILSIDGKKTEFQEFKEKTFRLENKGTEQFLKGDDVIAMPNGKLVTVYSSVKKGLLGSRLSEVAENGEKKQAEKEETPQIDTDSGKLSKCPSCGKMTLKMEGGCNTCIDKECGYSQCDV